MPILSSHSTSASTANTTVNTTYNDKLTRVQALHAWYKYKDNEKEVLEGDEL